MDIFSAAIASRLAQAARFRRAGREPAPACRPQARRGAGWRRMLAGLLRVWRGVAE